MTSARELAELYSTLGRRVLAQRSTDGALGAVTSVAVDAIPGVAYASITRRRGTEFQTLGATHPDAVVNDRTQYETDSGPCLDVAVDHATVILVRDVAHDPRYPVFGPAAAATGVASMLSTRLVSDEGDLKASLNLYAQQPGAFDDTAQTVALVMATHGALAVAGVVARENGSNLERALGNSRNIGMAMGILMASQLVTVDQAFTLLRLASQNGNRKIHDIAADVVATGTLDMPGHGRPTRRGDQ